MGAFGVMVLVAGLALQGVMQGPPTVLAAHAPTSEVAAFAVPAIIMQQLVSIGTSTNLGFLSFASGESTAPDRAHLAAVFQSNIRMTLLVIGLPITYVSIFGHVLLTTWIGANFADAASGPLRYLTLAGLFLALSAAPADVARGLGRPGWLTVYTLTEALIAIGGSLLLVSHHGAEGAAIALLAAMGLSTLPFAALVSRRLLGIPTKLLAQRMARPVIVVACGAALFMAGHALTSGFVVAIIVGFLVTLPYGFAVIRFVADDRERDVLRGVFHRSNRR
jgi:O-antigen/teichoic acid export membrane protein